MRKLLWLLDEGLDRIPRYEDGKWHRYGDWGCGIRNRLGLNWIYDD